VYEVDAVSEEVAPVAVIAFDPPVVSATTRLPATYGDGHEPNAFVVHCAVPRLVEVNAVVANPTVSLAPNPVAVKVPLPMLCSGKPKLVPPAVKVVFGVIVNTWLTEFVPSVMTIVSEPPGIAGTVNVLLNEPTAVVVTHPVGLAAFARLSIPFTPPPLVLNVPAQLFWLAVGNQKTVDVPTVDDTDIGALLLNPTPVIVRAEPTVPAVTPVSSVGPPKVADSPEIVDRVTEAFAACAL